jgi:hypothetical protein
MAVSPLAFDIYFQWKLGPALIESFQWTLGLLIESFISGH